MFGNGLRKKIWKDFQTRFNIKQIVEFYGSTEGNANVGQCLKKIKPSDLIRFQTKTFIVKPNFLFYFVIKLILIHMKAPVASFPVVFPLFAN